MRVRFKVLVLLLFVTTHVSFAAKFYSQGTGNFSATTNWDTNPIGGGADPVAGDFVSGTHQWVIQDGDNITLDLDVDLDSITIGEGVSGSLIFGNDGTADSMVIQKAMIVALGGSVSHSAIIVTDYLELRGSLINNGTFDLKSGTGRDVATKFNNTSAATISGGIIPQFSNLTFDGSAIVDVTQRIDVEGSIVIEDGATFDDGDSTHTVAGNWTENGTGQMIGNGTIIMDNALTQTITTTAAFNNLIFNGGVAATATIAGAITVNGDFLVTNNTTVTSSINGHTLNGDFQVDVGATYNQSAAGRVLFYGVDTQNIVCNGDVDIFQVFTDNGNNTLPKIFSGSLGIASDFRVLNTSHVMGDVNISIANMRLNGTCSFSDTITFTGGTLRDDGTDNSFTLGSATINIEGNTTLNAGDTMHVGGDFAISSNYLIINADAHLKQDSLLKSFSMDVSTILYVRTADGFPVDFSTYSLVTASRVRYDLNQPQTVRGNITYGNLEVVNDTKTVDGPLDVDNRLRLYNGCTLELGSYAHTVANDVDYVSGAACTINSSDSLILDGEDNNQTLDANITYNLENIVFTNTAPTAVRTKNIDADLNVGGDFIVTNTGGSSANYLIVDIDGSNIINDGDGSYSLGQNVHLHSSGESNFDSVTTFNTVTMDSLSLIRFDGTDQNIPALTYGAIELNGNGAKTAQGNILVKRFVERVGATPVFADAGFTHQVKGDWLMGQAYATAASMTGKMIFNGGDQNISASFFETVEFAGTGTKTTTGNLDVDDSLLVKDGVTFSTDNNINVGGHIRVFGDGFYKQTANTTTFDGIGLMNVTFNDTSYFYRLTINPTAGLVQILTDIAVKQDLVIENGKIMAGQSVNIKIEDDFYIGTSGGGGTYTTNTASTITMNGVGLTQTILNYGNASFGNLVFTGGSEKRLGINTFDVSGDITIDVGTILDANNEDIEVEGNWINNGSFSPTGRTVTFDGSVSGQTITSSDFNNLTISNFVDTVLLLGNQTLSGNLVIDNNAILDANDTGNYFITVENWWDNDNGGDFLAREGTVVFNGAQSRIFTGGTGAGHRFYNVVSNSLSTTNNRMDGDMDIDGDFTINPGSGIWYTYAYDMYFSGNIYGETDRFNCNGVNTLYFDAIAGSFEFDPGNAASNFRNIELTGGATYSLLNDLVHSTGGNYALTVSSGILDLNGHNLQIQRANANCDIVINGGTLEVDSGASIIMANNNDFIFSSGVFRLVGHENAPATLTSAGGGFDFDMTNGTIHARNYSIERTRGNGLNITGGNIDATNNFSDGIFANGAGSYYLTLDINLNDDTATGVTFSSGPSGNINRPNAAPTGELTFLNPNGSLAGEIYENDADGEIHWDFSGNITWDGGGSSNSWFHPDNWNPNGVPTDSDNVLIDHSIILASDIIVEIDSAKLAVCNNLTITTNGANNIDLNWVGGNRDLQVYGDVTLSDGRAGINLASANDTMNVYGSWDNNGTFVSASGVVVFNDTTGGVHNITSGGTGNNNDFDHLVVNASSSTYNLQSDIDIDEDFVLIDGTWNTGGSQMNVAGNWTKSGTATFSSTDAVIFDGANSVQTVSGATVFYNLTINGSGTDTVRLDANITVENNVQILTGVMDAQNNNIFVLRHWRNNVGLAGFIQNGIGTVIFNGTATQIVGTGGSATTFANVLMQNSGRKEIRQDMNVTTNWTINDEPNRVEIEPGVTINSTFSGNDFTMTGSNLWVYGANNFPDSFATIALQAGYVTYRCDCDQMISSQEYYNIDFDYNGAGARTKTAKGNITIKNFGRILDTDTRLDMDNFDMELTRISGGESNDLQLPTGGKQIDWGTGTLTHSGDGWDIDADIDTINNLVLIDGDGSNRNKELNSDMIFTGDVTVQAGSRFDMDVYTARCIAAGKTFTLASGTRLLTYTPSPDTAFPTGFTTYDIDENTLTWFLDNGGLQLMYDVPTYGNVIAQNTGTLRLLGDIDVNGDFDISNGGERVTLDDNGFDMNLAGSDIRLVDYTPSANTTVTFDGGDQTMVDDDGGFNDQLFYNVRFTNAGVKTFSDGGETIDIQGTWRIDSAVVVSLAQNTFFSGDSIINYYGRIVYSDNSLIFDGDGNQIVQLGEHDTLGGLTFSGDGGGNDTVTFIEYGIDQEYLGDPEDFIIDAGMVVEMGSFTHKLSSNDIVNNGTWITKNSRLVFDRDGQQDIAGIDTARSILLQGSNDKDMQGSWVMIDSIIIDAGVTLDAIGANHISLTGSWISNGTYNDRDASITTFESTDGTAQSINNNGSNFYLVKFNQVNTNARTYTLLSDVRIEDSLLISNGATFDINGNTLTLGDNDGGTPAGEVIIVDAGATLEVDADAVLSFNHADLDPYVIVNGMLRLVGTDGNPATVTREAGTNGRTRVDVVNGTIEAQYYNFEYLGDTGIWVRSAATLHDTRNFSNGVWGQMRTGGAGSRKYLQLDADLTTVDSIRDVTFDYGGTPAAGTTFNVGRAAGATDTAFFTGDISGILAGYVYEDDDNSDTTGLIRWNQVNQVTWIGGVSINWHNPNNWSPATVPTPTITANIPAGAPNDPTVFADSAECLDLNITNGNLILELPIEVFGDVSLGNTTAGLIAVANDSALISVGGSWAKGNGGTFTHGNSKVIFSASAGVVNITPNGAPFNKIEFTGAAQSNIVGNTITVEDSFIVSAHSQVTPTTGNYTLNLEGDFVNNGTYDNTTAGTTIFNGNVAQSIHRGRFYNLTISGSNIKTVSDTLDVLRDVIVNSTLASGGTGFMQLSSAGVNNTGVTINVSGTFDDGNRDHEFYGRNWIGTGNYSGTGTITFLGNREKDIYDSKFATLVLNGTANVELLGAVSMTGDLTVKNTINVFDLNSEQITATGAGQVLTIEAGERMDVTGAANFPDGFASFVMDTTSIVRYDGVVDQMVGAATYGTIQLYNTAKTLEGNIDIEGNMMLYSGSLDVSASNYSINCAGRFYTAGGTDFIARSGTITFDGSVAGNQDVDHVLPGTKDFYNVVVNKSAGTLRFDLEDQMILRDLTAQNGIVSADGHTITIGRSLLATNGTYATSGTYRLTHSTAAATAFIQTNGSTLNDLTVVAGATTTYQCLDDLDVGNNYTLTSGTVDGNSFIVYMGNGSDVAAVNGTHKVGAGGEIRIGNDASLTIGTTGSIEIVGNSSNLSTVTRRNVGRYNLTINGRIKAQYALFEYMKGTGVYLTTTAKIDTTDNFSHCTFTNGAANGVFLRVETNQNMDGTAGTNRIENVSFPSNPGGGATNVSKVTTSTGNILFYASSGNFEGESFDNDPNNLIDWESTPKLIWKTTAANTDWYNENNWTATSGPDTFPYCGIDVLIPSGATNYPIITSAGARAGNLEIESGAFLTLNTPADSDTDLVVCGDMEIDGSFTLSSSTDSAVVTGNWLKTGLFTPSTGTILLLSDGPNFMNNGITPFYNLVIGGTGSVQFFASTTTNGDFDILPGGTADFDIYDFDANKNFRNNGTLNQNSGIVQFSSPDATTYDFEPGGATYNQLRFSGGASNIIQLTGALSNTGNLNVVSGTFTTNGQIFNFGNGADVISVSGTGTFDVDENSSLRMAPGASMSVTSGATFRLVGLNNANPAQLTRQSTGNYGVTISSGATVHANYYTVDYINTSGIVVNNGVTVNTVNNFSNGTFSNGQTGGRYLLLNADFAVTDTIEEVDFNTGPTYNVARTTGANEAVFKNSGGTLFAWLYENDVPANQPNTGEIRWVFDYPVAAWLGAADSNWHNAANWDCGCVPDETYGVFIPNRPKDPVIYAADAEALEINMYQASSELEIRDDNDLSVLGDFSNLGTITVQPGSASNIEVHGLWAMASGATFTNGGASTVTLKAPSGANVITTGGDCFYNLTIDSTGIMQSSSSICVEGDLQILQGTFNMSSAAHTLTVKGDFINNAIFSNSATLVTFDGTNDQSIDGATFTDLTFGGTGTKTLTGKVIVNGDVGQSAGVTLDGGVGGDTLALNGDWDLAFGSSFNANTSTVTFVGSSIQNVNNASGNDMIFNDLEINNTAVDALKPQIRTNGNIEILASGSLKLTDGVFSMATTSDTMIVNDDVTLIGGNMEASYVSGWMKKVGDDAWTFPIGSSDRFARIGISAPATATSAFAARYNEGNTGNYWVPPDSVMTRVSSLEYWDLDRVTGSDDVFVTLYWEDGSFSDIDDLDSLVVAHFDGAYKWDNMGQSATTGTVAQGSITSGRAVSNFSPFTFGSIGEVANPLPIELISFEAQLLSSVVELNWSTALEVNANQFVIQRSSDASNFEVVGSVEAIGNGFEVSDYVFHDESPLSGVSYYRLKMLDNDASFEYSGVRVINNDFETHENQLLIVPNPATSLNAKVIIDLDRSEGDVNYTLQDISGRLCYAKIIPSDQEGIVIIDVDPENKLKKGIYFVAIKTFSGYISKKLVLE